MESSGGMIDETVTLLLSLCGIIDRHKGLSPGCFWQECQVRLAIDLQRGSEVFTGHAANNGLRIFMRKLSTAPPRPFVRPASDLIKGMIISPYQVFE